VVAVAYPSASEAELTIEANTASFVNATDLELALEKAVSFRWSARLTYNGVPSGLLVAPGDGSTQGRRTPILDWIVETEAGDSVEPPDRILHCGNINPLRSDEVVLLESGESLIFDVGRPYIREKGVYLASLRYTNDPQAEWGGILLGPHAPGGMEAVRKSTACSVVSNRVRIVRE
jgi:hypothetical protein